LSRRERKTLLCVLSEYKCRHGLIHLAPVASQDTAATAKADSKAAAAGGSTIDRTPRLVGLDALIDGRLRTSAAPVDSVAGLTGGPGGGGTGDSGDADSGAAASVALLPLEDSCPQQHIKHGEGRAFWSGARNVFLYRAPSPFKARQYFYASHPVHPPTLHALGATALVRVAPEMGPRGDFDYILAQLNASAFVYKVVAEALSAAATAAASASASAGGAAGEGGDPPAALLSGPSGSGMWSSASPLPSPAAGSSPPLSAFVPPCSGGAPSSSGRQQQPQQPRQQQQQQQQQQLASQRPSNANNAPMWRVACRRACVPLLYLAFAFRVVAGAVIVALQARLPSSVPLFGGTALYEWSSFARQLHLKLCDVCRWPLNLRKVQNLRHEVLSGRRWHSPDLLFSDTAHLMDSAFRWVLDTVLGIGVCLLLAFSPWAVRLVLRGVHIFGRILHIEVLRAWVDWLMWLPAGLKLNHAAGVRIGGAVLSCIDFWDHITTFLNPYEPFIVLSLGVVGLGGSSLLLATASDVLDLATLHIYMLYTQFAWLHNQQVGVFASLWRLFRGKKKNILRNRVDSNDYDAAQLLLGTLFFAVVFFLFPTTLVYYAFFLAVWLCIQAARGALWWLITILNNLPAFTIYCLLFSSSRLPAGVCTTLVGVDAPQGSAFRLTQSLRSFLKSVPRASAPGRRFSPALHAFIGGGGGESSDDMDLDVGASSASRSRQVQRRGTGAAYRSRSYSGRLNQRLQAASCEYLPPAAERAEEDPVASGEPIPLGSDSAAVESHGTTLWFRLHSLPASLDIAFAPLGDALAIVMQRYTVGTLLRTILLGERVLSLFRSIPANPSAGTMHKSAAAAGIDTMSPGQRPNPPTPPSAMSSPPFTAAVSPSTGSNNAAAAKLAAGADKVAAASPGIKLDSALNPAAAASAASAASSASGPSTVTGGANGAPRAGPATNAPTEASAKLVPSRKDQRVAAHRAVGTGDIPPPNEYLDALNEIADRFWLRR
jgi:hypothetical protein